MKRSIWRPVVAVTVLVATVTAFIWYFVKHPEVRQQLSQTSPSVLILLLALYLCGIVALAFVTVATVRLYKLRLGASESLLLTMYTAIINFFGPLQSGPAFRAVYLKKKHGFSLKHYTVATLVYYCLYGGISVLL
ncbi:MAG TPA: lysylphosphatidylglycerol synthase domain-containing protein, partial [Candidatus Saccharimonadales bacterium]|nr:lysylphosphatidylglycerol synthase domain-containing protein [Candidatus Saccharimonadales bacterium]